MNRLLLTLLLTIFAASYTHSQQPANFKNLTGKTFVSRTLEYMKIINDSTLCSSLNFYTDTAGFFLRHDTFYIKQKYLQTDNRVTKFREKLYDYKVMALSADTFKLKNDFRLDVKPFNWEDTLLFINIEKLKEPVTAFRLLQMDCSGKWTGKRHVFIDSIGRVAFIDEPLPDNTKHAGADKNAKPKYIVGQLTQKEFTNFKNLLSLSLPSKLPPNRGCPTDGEFASFEILIGTKKITSIGCDLSWSHTFLFNYIYDIDKNKGWVKKTN